MKLKKGFIKHVCIDKLLNKLNKFLLKLDKNIKSIESKKTMDPILAKSNMRKTSNFAKSTLTMSILNNMGVLIPDPSTMKSNVMAS